MGTRTYLYTVVFYQTVSPFKKTDDTQQTVLDEFPCGGQTCKKILNYINSSNTWFRKIAKTVYESQRKIIPISRTESALIITIDTYLIRKSNSGYFHRILACWSYQYSPNEYRAFCYPKQYKAAFDHAFRLHENPEVANALDFSKCSLPNDCYVYRNVTNMYADFYDRKIAASEIGMRLESTITKMGANEISSEYHTLKEVRDDSTATILDTLAALITAYQRVNQNTVERLQKIIEEVGDHFDWRDGYVE